MVSRLDHHARAAPGTRSPSSTWRVARGSRSRLRTFCDLAYVHAQSSPSRTHVPERHQVRPAARRRWWRRSRPLLREERRDLLGVIAIWSRRLIGRGHRRATATGDRALGGRADGRPRVLGLEHDGVAGLLEHLADQPVDARRSRARRSPRRRRARRPRCAPRAPSGRARARSRRAPVATPAPRRSAASRRRRRPGRRRRAARTARRSTVADLIRSRRKWRTSSRAGSKLATYQPSRPLISA